MMFTYPVMVLLTRTKFFGEGRKFSGMDAAALGREPTYRGAGRTKSSKPTKRRSAWRLPRLLAITCRRRSLSFLVVRPRARNLREGSERRIGEFSRGIG